MPKALRFLGWPVLVGVLLALLIIQHNPELVGLPRQEVHVEQAPLLSRLQEGPVSYANAVSRAAPAVANLYTTKMVSKPSHPLFDDPMFRRFFGDNLPQQKRMESSLGSAVIMSAEGYLLTNNHVTAGADQIIVALRDGRETIAQLVGSDPETDLAVLKIDLKNLPAMTLGRSDGIRTGDVCLAIGNPFGVGQTVTMGIISATGRNQLGLNTYEDFIQTDAAINPGNSGGALVDAAGNLIGINTAIFSKSGGSQGIGFAIPTKLALEVMQSIIEHGQVIRGWLGVEVKALTPEVFAERVEAEWANLKDGPSTLTEAEVQRVAAHFVDPAYKTLDDLDESLARLDAEHPGFARWRARNTFAHKKPGYVAVTLSLKPTGTAPGDVTDKQLEAIADLADRYSFGEVRNSHNQNIILADVEQGELFALWGELRELGFATPNVGLLTDIICCPGGDFCSLANAKSIPIAEAIQRRFDNLDYLFDIGDIDLNISGCMNACGHHHVGHIGILGVDKKGAEFYQVSLGGSSARDASLGQILGPSFAQEQMADVIDKIIQVYVERRTEEEPFIDTFRRIGIDPFKERVYAANH